MGFRDLLRKPLGKALLFAAMAGSAAAQRPVQPPTSAGAAQAGQEKAKAPLAYAPNVFLGEYHDEDSDRKIEADFLKKYAAKYGQNGRPLVLAVELGTFFQEPADIYFKSKRTTKDKEAFWTAIVRLDYPDDHSLAAKMLDGKVVGDYVHAQKPLFGNKLGEAAQRRGLIDVATEAYDHVFTVKFVDKGMSHRDAISPQGMTDRNDFMGKNVAELIEANDNGVVIIDGVPHNTTRVQYSVSTTLPEETKKNVEAKSGDVPPIFVFNVSRHTADEGGPQVKSADEMMKLLPSEPKLKEGSAFQYSSPHQSGAETQSDRTLVIK